MGSGRSARQAKTRAAFIRSLDGRLLSRPEAGIAARYMLNSIARCHVCNGPLLYVGKGPGREPSYYCSNRNMRGPAACSNGKGIPVEGLDHAVNYTLWAMLNRDFDKVVDLCMEQAAIWREKRAASAVDREAEQREISRLEGIVAKLTDAIENSQPVGTRLKERQQELDNLRATLEVPEPMPDRKTFENLCAPLGPLVGLGVGRPRDDPVLRKIGVTSIVVTPLEEGGWSFKGQGDFGGLLHRRVQAAPPPFPPGQPKPGIPQHSAAPAKAGARM